MEGFNIFTNWEGLSDFKVSYIYFCVVNFNRFLRGCQSVFSEIACNVLTDEIRCVILLTLKSRLFKESSINEIATIPTYFSFLNHNHYC